MSEDLKRAQNVTHFQRPLAKPSNKIALEEMRQDRENRMPNAKDALKQTKKPRVIKLTLRERLATMNFSIDWGWMALAGLMVLAAMSYVKDQDRAREIAQLEERIDGWEVMDAPALDEEVLLGRLLETERFKGIEAGIQAKALRALLENQSNKAEVAATVDDVRAEFEAMVAEQVDNWARDTFAYYWQQHDRVAKERGYTDIILWSDINR